MTTHQQPPEPSILDGYRYRRRGPVELYLGDAAEVLAAMPDDSVDCLVTSPPFWGLRDYGTGHWEGGDTACPHRMGRTRCTDGVTCPACQARWVDPQYGLEGSLDDYLGHLIAVFDQARRVLAPTGTCWVNLGDSYSAGTRLAYDTASGIAGSRQLPAGRSPAPLPAKNLLGVPWRAAFAIQACGWILRNAVVWAKSNPMPESVRDRLSATYELLFLFSKSQRYFFTLDPIRIPLARPDAADGTRIIGGIHKGRTGGVDATRRRRGTSRYGASKHTGELAAGAGSGNLRPVGHAHTAAHPAGRNPGDDLLTAPTTPLDHLDEGVGIIWRCTAWQRFEPSSWRADWSFHASARYASAAVRRCRTWSSTPLARRWSQSASSCGN